MSKNANASLNRAQFEKISGLVYKESGINLQPGKEELIKSRLTKRLNMLSLESFDQYLGYIERDRTGAELTIMVEALTTNKTFFFREIQHFDYLRQQILPQMKAGGRVRIWSAGCSSGEEPYSIGILLREELKDVDRRDTQILATDLSSAILAKAREAVYQSDTLSEVPQHLLRKYFTPTQDKSAACYRVNDPVRRMVRLARLNLMGAWPMKGPFDVIFCRNVMIYFDKPTQQALVRRFWELLSPGGHLFVGHAESLTASSTGFRYIRPAVYVK